MSSQTLGSNGLEGGRGGSRRLKTQLSLQRKRPAGPRPNHALKCDTQNHTNRESVHLTETLTDGQTASDWNWKALGNRNKHVILKLPKL